MTLNIRHSPLSEKNWIRADLQTYRCVVFLFVFLLHFALSPPRICISYSMTDNTEGQSAVVMFHLINRAGAQTYWEPIIAHLENTLLIFMNGSWMTSLSSIIITLKVAQVLPISADVTTVTPREKNRCGPD